MGNYLHDLIYQIDSQTYLWYDVDTNTYLGDL